MDVSLILALMVMGVMCVVTVGFGVYLASRPKDAPGAPSPPANDTRLVAKPNGGSGGGGGGGGGGQWVKGKATYYSSANGGPVGANGKRLTAFKSVAVRIAEYSKLKGKKVEFKGLGVMEVEDSCPGGECMDFDIFVGDDVKNAERIPNWKMGNIPVEYRWV